MCLNILKDSSKALAEAKKKRDIKKSILVLGETAVAFAVASGVLAAKAGLVDAVLISSIVSVFIAILIAGLLLSLVVHVSTVTLGAKGKFYEGLTVVSYSFVPMAAGVLVAAVLAWLPFAFGVQLIVLSVGFAMGLAILYKGVKDLYSTDLVVAFVSLSITILALMLAAYASIGLAVMSGLATVAPVV